MVNEKIYDHNVVKKPWGFEYVLYRNKDLCITYLNIEPKQSTSLHSHVYKKTGFLVLQGEAHIQLGLYKSQIEKFKSVSKVMIRPGLFHQISNKSKNKLIALEFESPTGKQDLVRFEDKYGRTKKKYEGMKDFKQIKKPFILKNFNKVKIQKFKINKVKIDFFKKKKINISKKTNTIYSILKGEIVNNLGKNTMPLGDIIKTGTLKKILNKFKVKKDIIYLEVKH